MEKATGQYVTLCGTRLHGLRHVCGFFDSVDEQYEVLTPYLKEGLDTGDQVITILESKKHAPHKARLESSGIPVSDASDRQQLKVLATEDTYLSGGTFAAERMYELLEHAL